MGKLDGHVALVTGANRGIGKGIARALAGEAATLTLTSRGVEDLQQAAQELTAQGAAVLDGVTSLDFASDGQRGPHAEMLRGSSENATLAAWSEE
jgi:NAD(P)-dependent dehydrogenase (short-subunit alcohol dehydrogenase family)